MTAHLSPVEAYRRDLARQARSEPFGEEDDGWLLLAHAVQRRAAAGAAAAEPPAAGASELRRLAASVAAAAALDDGQTAAVMGAADRMEDAGALLLAASTLASLTRLIGEGDGRLLMRGRVIAQWARVERMLGETDVAADLYARASRLGAQGGVPELRVRADLGLGVLARMRGNYPEARQRFRRALAAAERAGLAELTGIAHQSLLIAAAVARDFDTALSHGWSALAHVAGDPAREADVLVNLATLCLDAGEDAAALQGFLAAAERGPRIRVAARAGAAVAAARTGERALFASCVAAVERALSGEMAPYERAQRLLTLSDAWRAAGDAAAEASARRRGLEVARAHGFAELVHEYERARAPAEREAPAPRALGTDARRVVRALAGLDEGPASGARDRAQVAAASRGGEDGG